MNTRLPTRIAILALPETSASVVYGMYDLFKAAGRDWQVISEGRPGMEVIAPQVVSAHGASFIAGNGVRIMPDASLAACMEAEVICVPELLVTPARPWKDALLKRYAA
jgi:transcriptional regulator GlxA family with amidase domain